jgi:hypothetical protein
MKAVSIEEILQKAKELNTGQGPKKLLVEISRFKEIFENPYIEIEVPTIDLLAASMERAGRSKNTVVNFGGESIDVDYLASNIIVSPDIGSERLRNSLGCKTKIETLRKLFTEDEIKEILDIAGNHYGKNKPVRFVEEIKN